MSIEDSLCAFLKSDPATVNLVAKNSRGEPCITPDQGIENYSAFPRLVYRKNSDTRVYSDAGDSGLRTARFEVECQAKTIRDAEQVRDALATLLSGIGNAYVFGANRVNRLFVADDYDTPYPAIHGEEVGIRAKTLELELDYV